MTGKVASHVRMVGGIGHPRQRAEPQALAGQLDPAEPALPSAIDVDHALRPHDVELHQVDQRGAAGEELAGCADCAAAAARRAVHGGRRSWHAR